MKEIEILVGCPRKNGNTNYLSNYLNKLLINGENKSHISRLYNYNIKPCIDRCNCKKGDLKCTMKDEAEIIFNRIESADVSIIASPIYWFSVTAKPGGKKFHKIRMIKEGANIHIIINGTVCLDYTDPGNERWGPILGGGKISFRQMAELW